MKWAISFVQSLPLFAALVLPACADARDLPAPTDAVQDSATAIQLGREACKGKWQAMPNLGWTADFSHGVWQVTVPLKADFGLDVKIHSADGKPDDCVYYGSHAE
jgi:hypothetical protein